MTDLGKRRLARVGDHGERCDDLLLDVPLRLLGRVRRGRVEQLQQPLDDLVEVRDQRLALDALAEVDERRGRVRVYSVWDKSAAQSVRGEDSEGRTEPLALPVRG